MYRIKYNGAVERSDINNITVSLTTVRPQGNPQRQNESVLNEARFRKLEEEIKKILGKLDEINNKKH